MTPKYHWVPIIRAFGTGILLGPIISLVFVVIVAIFVAVISWLIPTPPNPPGWAVILLLCFGLVGAPVLFAIAMAWGEAADQAIEYRSVLNECQHCGYSLRGIRKTSDRCPECGELFKKLP